MLTSSRRGISYPNPGTRADRADVPTDIAAVIAALELDVVFSQGTLALRPAAGTGSPAGSGGGRFYWATDTSALYYDTGSAWIGPLNQQALGTGSVTSAMILDGTIASVDIANAAIITALIANGAVTAAKLEAALFPSQGAGLGTEALRALGTALGQAARGDFAVNVYAEDVASQGLNGQSAADTWYPYVTNAIACQITIPVTGVWEVEGFWWNERGLNVNRARWDRNGLSVNGANPVAPYDWISPRDMSNQRPISVRARMSLSAGDTLRYMGLTVQDMLESGVTTSHRSLKAQRIS